MRFVVPEDEVPVFSEEQAFPLGRAQTVQFQAKINLPEAAQRVPLYKNQFIISSKNSLKEAIWEFLEEVLPPVPNVNFPTVPHEYWFHGGQWAKLGPLARQRDEKTRNMDLEPYKFAIIGYRAEICQKGFEALDSHIAKDGTLRLAWANGIDKIKVIYTQRDISCNGKTAKETV